MPPLLARSSPGGRAHGCPWVSSPPSGLVTTSGLQFHELAAQSSQAPRPDEPSSSCSHMSTSYLANPKPFPISLLFFPDTEVRLYPPARPKTWESPTLRLSRLSFMHLFLMSLQDSLCSQSKVRTPHQLTRPLPTHAVTWKDILTHTPGSLHILVSLPELSSPD